MLVSFLKIFFALPQPSSNSKSNWMPRQLSSYNMEDQWVQ